MVWLIICKEAPVLQSVPMAHMDKYQPTPAITAQLAAKPAMARLSTTATVATIVDQSTTTSSITLTFAAKFVQMDHTRILHHSLVDFAPLSVLLVTLTQHIARLVDWVSPGSLFI